MPEDRLVLLQGTLVLLILKTLATIDDISHDLKYAARQLRRSPGFGAIVVLSVGIAVGANAAIFSVVDAVLLRPLPYADSDRLVRIDGVFTRLPLRVTETGIELAYPVVAPELSNGRSFASIGAYSVSGLNLGDGNPERLRAATVTPGFFAALNVTPAVGRAFTDADLKVTDRIAVISYRLWQRRFQSDPSVVGQSITLNGRQFSVAGVMPDRVEFPGASDVWIPQASDPQVASQVAVPAFIARLAPDVTPSSAREEVLRLIQGRAITRQDAQSSNLKVIPLREALSRDVRSVLVLVMTAALLVLLVACLNTASLLLTRISAREREFAVRRAIGASRLRLVRQVSCESLLLAAVAGVVAIPIAFWTLDAVRIFIPAGLHGGRAITIDHRTLAALGLLSLAAAGLFGLAPSLSAHRRAAIALRVSSSTTEDRSWRRFRSALVTLEIAMAVAILIAATTIVKTVGALTAVDLGARNETAIVMEVTLPRATYSSTDQIRRFYERLRDELQRVSGVQASGATNHLPGSSTVITPSQPMTLEGQTLPTSRVRNAVRLSATTGYFSALGIDVLAGRAFTDADRAGVLRTAIVSEGYVRAFGVQPDDILGRRVNVGLGSEQWAEVVGVVRDVRMRGPESDLQPAVYVPFAQTPINATGFVVVRAESRLRDVIPSIRSAVARVDASLPVYNLQTFGQIRSEYLATQRFTMTTMVAFGSVAFGLAALGLYGIISYLVRLRTREIGIRIAIGATSAIVRRQVIGNGALHAAAGIGIGLASALGLWRVVSAHVPGLGQVDAAGVAVVCTAVFIVSICAVWFPARRAARIDPLVALRSD
jgi:putative ABC transport system permease protein